MEKPARKAIRCSCRFYIGLYKIIYAFKLIKTTNKTNEALLVLEEERSNLYSEDVISICFNSGNGIVDAILSDKKIKAAEYNIEIAFEGAVPPSLFSAVDLCILYGNTIDNAIEACMKLPLEIEKTIELTTHCLSGYIFITIINPTVEDVIIKNNYVESTKEDKHLHGYGLQSLRKIVKKYKGDLSLKSENNKFIVSVDVPWE